jgi:hypothetical protein
VRGEQRGRWGTARLCARRREMEEVAADLQGRGARERRRRIYREAAG